MADLDCRTVADKLSLRLIRPWHQTAPSLHALKEFIETDGALPKSIEWIANKDLPPGTFPDP